MVSGLSPGTKPLRWKTIKVTKGDTDGHQKITEYWLSKLSVSAAMAGVALGKEKREAEDAADRLCNAESVSFGTQLREQLALITEAEK